MMVEPQIVSRDEWLIARKKLLDKEKAITRKLDALAVDRRRLPAVALDKNYRFQSETGAVTLQDLFGKHSQLVIYHFMFGADWEEGCTSCSFWADSFNSLDTHLAARDTAFACASTASLDKLQAYRKRMGWSFNWVSNDGPEFGRDFGVTFGDGEPRPEGYNYSGIPSQGERHGLSVFLKHEDNTILHTYSTYGRGVEPFNGVYGILDLTPTGRNEQDLPFTMGWVKRRDQYLD